MAKLIAYRLPESMTPLSLKLSGDAGIAVGRYEHLRIFGCKLQDVAVRVYGDITEIVAQHAEVDLNLTMFGAKSDHSTLPKVTDVLHAHIIRQNLPELGADFARFTAYTQQSLRTLGAIDQSKLSFSGSEAEYRGLKIDLWSLYSYYLMLDRKCAFHCGKDGSIQISSNVVQEISTIDWVRKYNQYLIRRAQELGLLCAYFDIGLMKDDVPTCVLVSLEGCPTEVGIDPTEIFYIIALGKYPEVNLEIVGDDRKVYFDFKDFLPVDYFNFVDNARAVDSAILDLAISI